MQTARRRDKGWIHGSKATTRCGDTASGQATVSKVHDPRD